jgi:hypothetical protein
MTTDYRALCAELINHLQVRVSNEDREIPTVGYYSQSQQLLDRARAALSQPEPVAPTDAEIEEWADAATEVPLEEMDPEVHGWRRCFTAKEFGETIRAALARWGAPASNPVPVSERLPGPEDCDAEGGCWWWHPDHKEDDFDDGWILLDPKWAGGRRDSDDSLIYTHWLPHWALPVPAIAAELEAQ